MKKYMILSVLLCLGFTGSLFAQSILPDTLLFVFKLHGQTRKYEMSFQEKQDSIYLHWGIERNLKWQSGSYAMGSDRKSTRLNSSHSGQSRMPSSA